MSSADEEQAPTQLDGDVNGAEHDQPMETEGNGGDDGEAEQEEDEPINKYEDDGFIVESLSGGEEEEQPARQRSRLKKKKEKKRKRVLEEEDYELIQENLGFKVPRPKLTKKEKPVVVDKAPRGEDRDRGNKAAELERLLFDDEDEEAPPAEAAPAPTREEPAARRRPDDDIFDSEEEDDFIVSDDEGGADEDPAARAARRKKRSSTMSYISTDSLVKAQDLYDYSEYMTGPTEEEVNVEAVANAAPTNKYSQYRKQGFEPAMLARKYMLPADDEIRSKDTPERLQLRPSRSPSDAELAEEADWIYSMAISTQVGAQYTQADSVLKIVNVLRMILVDHSEVPYISHYKKEQWQPELSVGSLWEIYDWDQRWVLFKQRKDNLKRMFDARNMMETSIQVDMCQREDDLLDFIDLWNSLPKEQSEPTEGASAEKKVKRPEQRDLYNVAKRSKAADFVQHFGLTLQQLSENVASHYQLHEPKDEQRWPADIATEYWNPETKEYKRPEDLIRAARHIMAQEISADPAIRTALRLIYNPRVAISTDPTDEGKREIDGFHRFRFVKRLRQKPLHKFAEGEFVLLQQAEKQGMITIRVELTENCEQKLQEQLERFFLSHATNNYANEWNEERSNIIKTALTQFLLPVFEKQALTKARRDAETYIAGQCARNLENLLLAGPYEPPQEPTAVHDHHHHESVTVLAVGLADDNTGLAMLGYNGEVREVLTLNAGIRTTSDVDLATEFVKKHAPTVIAVGGEGMRAYDVLQTFYRILTRIKEESEAQQVPNPCAKTRPIFADSTVARIFENSSRSAEQLRELSPTLRKAVSVGRRLLDPMLEICGLYNQHDEIFYLPLHPLQALIDKTMLRKQYERCFLNVVNAVGVDLNRVLQHPWMAPVLQFVCGLGPRKSDALIQAVRRVGGRIDRRDELKRRRFMGDVVFRNAAGFLYIRASSKDEDDEFVVGNTHGNVLDQTRIHPDDYMYAEKIAQDAFANTADDDDETDPVEKLMMDPEKLQTIDIEYFASNLDGGDKKRAMLQDIVNELNNPGADPRYENRPYHDPAPVEVFTMLTGETKESLRPGTLVNVTVVRPSKRGTTVRLDCGLEGEIAWDDLTDSSNSQLDINEVVQANTVIPARIISLDVDSLEKSDPRQKYPFKCQLASNMRTLRNVTDYLTPADRSTYLEETEADLKGFIAEEEERRERASRDPSAHPIRIAHPMFQNWSYEKCKEYLKDKEVGTCVVRPSTTQSNVVKILLKILPNVDVDLEAKYIPEPQRATRSSPQFRIKETEFADLNDLIVNYVDKISMYADDLNRHRKYRDTTREELERLVQEASEKGQKEYYVRASTSTPGVFELIVCPGRRARRIPIGVNERGYKAFGKVFQTPDAVFDYYKKNAKAIIDKLNEDEAARKRSQLTSAPTTQDFYSSTYNATTSAWGATGSDSSQGGWGAESAAPAALPGWGGSSSTEGGWGAQ